MTVDHKVGDQLFRQVDFFGSIYLADSFVSVPQKIESGNGEAKLYVGQESEELRNFFGSRPFNIRCFLKKSELIQFMEELRSEYNYPQQPYRRKKELPELFRDRRSKIEYQDEIIWFSFEEQDQIEPPRIYGKSQDDGYKFLRELPLPTLSYLSFMKLESSNEKVFHVRLFTDFLPLGSRYHPKENPNLIESLVQDDIAIRKIRKGQEKFRERVLNSCPFCPITKVSDDRILEAAHIKPYSKSSNDEKYDTFNGISLTPTIHSLYDKGFITVSEENTLMVSDWISSVTVRNLGIKNNLRLQIPEFDKRKEYFKFHQDNIFRA